MTASVPRSANSWTFEMLHDLPDDDGNRYELIDGRLLVSALPAMPHFRAVNLLHRLLTDELPRDILVSQTGGVLLRRRKDTYLIPDILVTPMTALKGAAPAFDPSQALLVVEVLSPSSQKNDNVTKRRYYGRMGIPHYWIVDAQQRELTVMTMASGDTEYRDVTIVEAGTEWHCQRPFSIRIDPAACC